jgi:diguanylate cyclase (GGDEF)-like protein
MSDRSVADEPAGEVNNAIAHALLRYVESSLGSDGLERLVDMLPGTASVTELIATSRWWPAQEFGELVLAAHTLTGDDDLGRRVGEQTLRMILGGTLADMLKMSGTPEVACAVMADYSTKMTKGRVISVVESTERFVVMHGVYADGVEPNAFSCGFTAGYFSSLPTLFDQLGTCVETACQGRGDEVCRFRVAWAPDPSRSAPDHEHDDIVVRGSSALEELENHHRMAARLVEAHEIHEVLDRVVASVGAAVGAPQYVLAVQLDDGAGRRVHQVGFDGDGADVLADMLDAGVELGSECLVTEIAHGERRFGHLVAVFLPEANPSSLDRRILRSYARFAAAAIQIVEALDAARRDRDTAQAMLGLASALAESAGIEAVALNLCAALPAATGCDVGTVWLADPETGEVVLSAATDRDGAPLPIDEPPARFDPENIPIPGGALVEPCILDVTQAAVHEMFGEPAYPYAESALVPIGPLGALVAVAGATFIEPLAGVERVNIGQRLRGLADQAAIAFENARLLEVMRHRALHDDLTGLPKRVLAEDRCRQALARRERAAEEVALLFLDVDDFKIVNDTYGHALGDQLLKAVAERLTAELRASDTCARVGGDEFVIILTGPAGRSSGAEVADRLTRALDQPFAVGDQIISVTASIGIAWAGPDVGTFDALVARADAAMYEAKAHGKGRLVISS